MLRRHDPTRPTCAPGAMHRFLMIALLVWVQVLGPFVHAHAGSAQVSGWHVHTPVPQATAGVEANVQQAPDAWRQSPEGPDAPEVGVAAGLPQPRDATVGLPAGTADGAFAVLLTAYFGPPSAPQDAPLRTGVAAAAAPFAAAHPGLPPLPHAPPIS